MSSYISYSFGLKHAKLFSVSLLNIKENHIVGDGSGDIILPKHLVNPTNHSLVRHLERPSSYFWSVTFLTWFTIFCVGLPLNGIAPLIMTEINTKHEFFFLGLVHSWYDGRRPFDINIQTQVWRLDHTFGECTRHFIQCGLPWQPSTKTLWYKIQTTRNPFAKVPFSITRRSKKQRNWWTKCVNLNDRF